MDGNSSFCIVEDTPIIDRDVGFLDVVPLPAVAYNSLNGLQLSGYRLKEDHRNSKIAPYYDRNPY